MERVLPHPDIKARLADLAVGLAADCDNPEAPIRKLIDENLKNARRLPFVAFITHDGKWVAGYGGSTDRNSLLEALQKAEKEPSLQASPAVRKKLAGLAMRAEKAAGREDWKTVVKAGQDARKLRGRCAERAALAQSVGKAREWARAEFTVAVRLAAKGSDVDGAEKKLKEIQGKFRGDPEADAAATGLKAIKRLRKILAAEKEGRNEELREKAAAEFDDPRWKAIFLGQEDEESVIEGLD